MPARVLNNTSYKSVSWTVDLATAVCHPMVPGMRKYLGVVTCGDPWLWQLRVYSEVDSLDVLLSRDPLRGGLGQGRAGSSTTGV